MSTNDVRIDITGCAGSGKSVLLSLVGHCLQQAGFNVRCVDELGEVNPSQGIDNLLALLREFPPRPGLVSVATHCGRAEEVLQFPARAYTSRNPDRVAAEDDEELVEVGLVPVLVEGVDHIVAQPETFLSAALRQQEAAHGEQVAQGNGHLRAVGFANQGVKLDGVQVSCSHDDFSIRGD